MSDVHRGEKTPLVSVLIVNWNGKKWLDDSLLSLRRQRDISFEVIVADNQSRDDSVVYIKKNYPEVRLVETGGNLGFAGGNNEALKQARGQFIFLLNNDTRMDDPHVLEKLVHFFDDHPKAASVQPKLRLMAEPDKLDAVGSYWTDYSFLYHVGIYKSVDLPMYNTARRFFSNKGAAMMIKKQVIDQVGLFDGTFWSYYEETDFCHRLWTRGYECWYYPSVEIFHALGGSFLTYPNHITQFHNAKNRLRSMLKNFQGLYLIWALLSYTLSGLVLAFFWLLSGKPKHSWAFVRALGWNIQHLPETLRLRRVIQKQRCVSDQAIFKLVRRNPRLRYFYCLVTDLSNYQDALT